MVPSVSSC